MQKMAAVEKNEKEIVSVEDDGLEAESVCWAFQCRFCQLEKVPNFVFSQVLFSLTLQVTNFYRSRYICSH